MRYNKHASYFMWPEETQPDPAVPDGQPVKSRSQNSRHRHHPGNDDTRQIEQQSHVHITPRAEGSRNRGADASVPAEGIAEQSTWRTARIQASPAIWTTDPQRKQVRPPRTQPSVSQPN